ncbi:imelysin family protein [Allopusillimonas ginsengisoli]|uniref:imelysin family protein n=1 Tax=Allopusillimonas ginsengisoli TaxID=453575 RepID=UPI0010203FD2|nr:imelysin family protein [Allopusillimonas ginsengisoli]TEA79543.1 aminopeptidase [Allopusillimonas ginsengisoli]
MKPAFWRYFSIAAALTVMPNAALAGELSDALGANLVRGYIAPATAQFQQAASEMEAGLAQFCTASTADSSAGAVAARDAGKPGRVAQEKPGKAGLSGSVPVTGAQSDLGDADALDHRFAALVRAWAGIEFLRFGPLIEDNRFERIFFWPDPRGIMLRQIQALLAQTATVSPDPSATGASTAHHARNQDSSGVGATAGLDAQTLATHSVAVQGLPALEYMLYRDKGLLKADAPQEPSFAANCAYALAIAGNLSNIGKDIAMAWRDQGVQTHQEKNAGLPSSVAHAGQYAEYFSHPASTNPVYRSTQEIAAEAIKAISTGLQFARDIKILPMLGKDADAANEKKAPFWRSGLFAQAMAASANGLSHFLGAGQWQYGQDEAWIGQSLESELDRAHSLFEAMSRDLARQVREADGYRQLTLAALLLQNSKNIVDQNMAPAFGARIGFNALDGD